MDIQCAYGAKARHSYMIQHFSGTSRARGRSNDRAGFSLVEMIVVLAIISVLTVVAIVGQNQFNNSLLLSDASYTVALSVRQAQSLGISSRTVQTGGSSFVPNTGYGVHFGYGETSFYRLFADTDPVSPGSTLSGNCPGHTGASGNPDAKPGDCVYSAGSDALIQTYRFDRGYIIYSVCGHVNASTVKCLGTGLSDVDSIDISFLRPNTQTVVVGTKGSSTYTALTDACIRIKSPNGPYYGMIYVSQAGEASVTTACQGSGWPP